LGKNKCFVTQNDKKHLYAVALRPLMLIRTLDMVIAIQISPSLHPATIYSIRLLLKKKEKKKRHIIAAHAKRGFSL